MDLGENPKKRLDLIVFGQPTTSPEATSAVTLQVVPDSFPINHCTCAPKQKATSQQGTLLHGTVCTRIHAVVDTVAHHDNKLAREFCEGIFPGEIVVFDRSHVDFDHFRDLYQREVWWVSRAEENMAHKVKTKTMTLADQLKLESKLEGLSEGQLNAFRTAVLRALEIRHGTCPEGIREVLEAIHDSTRLEQLLETAIRFNSVEDFAQAL